MKYVKCVDLYIPWKLGERGSTPRGATGPSLSFLFVVFFVCPSRYDARHRKPRQFVYALKLGGTGISPRPRTLLVFVPIFVFVLVLVLVLQQAATYSIAAVAGNWTILVSVVGLHVEFHVIIIFLSLRRLSEAMPMFWTVSPYVRDYYVMFPRYWYLQHDYWRIFAELLYWCILGQRYEMIWLCDEKVEG